ncbi:ORF3a [Alphamesonivirus daknongense]|uniref:ORF3a n=1 Tax=Alphamesonivirus daknongense TaxID=1945561 RepID=M4JTM9_9NIDO|nr:ORF3a [Alphamesonivirus 3]AGE00059.1 ORF3a [Alphamesonivirus 3]
MKPASFILLSLAFIGSALADDAPTNSTPTLCESNASQHCTSMGYTYCKSINGVQSCYCPHSKNYTSVIDVMDRDAKCSLDSSKYLDPHYWFRDLVAANITLLVLFTLFTWVYLIPIYAKVAFLYESSPSKGKRPLSYIPLLPRDNHGSIQLLPIGKSY